MNAIGSATFPEHFKAGQRARNLLVPHNNILQILDLCAGLALAHLFGAVLMLFYPIDLAARGIAALLSREFFLCIVIASLALRESRSTGHASLSAWRRVIMNSLFKCIFVLAAIGLFELAARPPGAEVWIWLPGWSVAFVAWFVVSRGAIIACLYRSKRYGVMREAVAVVGAPDIAGKVAMRLAVDAAVVAIFDEDLSSPGGDAPISATMTKLLELARDGAVDTIVVALDRSPYANAQPVLQHLDALPVQLAVCGESLGTIMPHGPMRTIGGVPMVILADRPLQYSDLLVKSFVDIVGAVILLCMLSPVALVVSLAIIADSRGPVIFRQQRSGWGGRLFTILKFRTMKPAVDAVCRQTLRNDTRCTRVGRVLRRTSLDELPQLWNVLRGEMSLVGPRPHAEMFHVVDQAGCRLVAEYAQRYRVKPGLTGWAQINGFRGAVKNSDEMRARIEYDLHYIDNWSLWLDISILARTPFAVLKGENAF